MKIQARVFEVNIGLASMQAFVFEETRLTSFDHEGFFIFSIRARQLRGSGLSGEQLPLHNGQAEFVHWGRNLKGVVLPFQDGGTRLQFEFDCG